MRILTKNEIKQDNISLFTINFRFPVEINEIVRFVLKCQPENSLLLKCYSSIRCQIKNSWINPLLSIFGFEKKEDFIQNLMQKENCEDINEDSYVMVSRFEEIKDEPSKFL